MYTFSSCRAGLRVRTTFCSLRLRPTFRSSKPSSDSALDFWTSARASRARRANWVKQLSSQDFKSILSIYVHGLIFSVAKLLASPHRQTFLVSSWSRFVLRFVRRRKDCLNEQLPHIIAIARILSAPRYVFGICDVGGAPYARPGLPRWCGAPRTRVVCAYLFRQGQAATRWAAYPRPQRLVAFASLSTSRVLRIWFVYHGDFLPQCGARRRDDKTDHH